MQTIYALWARNMKEFVRDKTRLIFSLIFPFFFVYVFSAIFQNDHIDNAITYMLAGIISSTVFEVSLRVSSSTITDMTSGFMKEVLVSPISRLSIAIGQFLSSATISTAQGFLILIVGFFIGFEISSPLTLIYIVLSMIYIGLVFSGFGLFIATRTKNTQTFQIVSMAITMPMTFISGAFIPFSLLPETLRYIGYLNPLAYAVALFRAISLEKLDLSPSRLILEELAFDIAGFVVTPSVSLIILLIFGALFLVLSTSAFLNADFSKINHSKSDSIEW